MVCGAVDRRSTDRLLILMMITHTQPLKRNAQAHIEATMAGASEKEKAKALTKAMHTGWLEWQAEQVRMCTAPQPTDGLKSMPNDTQSNQ